MTEPAEEIVLQTTDVSRIPEIVAGVRAGFQSHKTFPLEYRVQELRNLKRLLDENESRIGEALWYDLQKSEMEAQIMEVNLVRTEVVYALNNLESWMTPKSVETNLLNKLNWVYRQPELFGTTLILSAWNYPLQLLLAPLVGAIAAGNSCIVKPSEISVATSNLMAELLPKYLDNECYAVVTGGVEVGQALLKEQFDYILYTEQQRLIDAAGKGSIEEVRQLLKEGVDANCMRLDDRITPLHVASQGGHTKVVKLLLDHGADIRKFAHGRTPLYMASQGGHTEVVKLLLDHGADVEYGGSTTPFFCASQGGHTEVVKLLLERGADSSRSNLNGWNSLRVASQGGHAEVVKLLLERGAGQTPIRSYRVCVRGDGRQTPLHMASCEGHVEVGKLLLDRGAYNYGIPPDTDQGEYMYAQMKKSLLDHHDDDDGNTPLHGASQGGHTKMVKLLLDHGADVNRTNTVNLRGDDSTPLHVASQGGHTEVVKLLLERGADIRMRKRNGMTPLHIASQGGHTEVVKMLLDHGADVNGIGENRICQETPLHHACDLGHTEMVKLLLDRGADIRMCMWNGMTPLHIASQGGYTEIVKMLLDHDADIRMCTRNGMTPLHIASQGGYTEIVKMLLDHDADIRMCTCDGMTPLHIASHGGHTEVVKLLLGHDADVNVINIIKNPIFMENEPDHRTPLHMASSKGHIEVVRFLLDNGADVKLADKYKETPLHQACGLGHTEVVKILLEHDADTNVVNKRPQYREMPLHQALGLGYAEAQRQTSVRQELHKHPQRNETPLHMACYGGHTEVVELLLNHGADVRIKNEDDWTPLHSANCYMLKDSNTEMKITQMLLEHHVDINGQTKLVGETSLHMTSFRGHAAVVKILLDHGASANIINKNEETPLHRACGVQSLFEYEPMKAILSDPEVRWQTCYGLKNDQLSYPRCHQEVVRILLDHDADVNIMNAQGRTAIDVAEAALSPLKKLLVTHKQNQDKLKDEVKFQGLQESLEESQKQVEELKKKIQQMEAASSHGHQNPKLEDRPTLQQFQCLKWKDEKGKKGRIRIMNKVASQWRQLGIALGFTSSKLSSIETTCRGDAMVCMEKLFGEWEQSGEEFSWKGLIEALEDADLGNVAHDVKKALVHDQIQQ